MKLKNTFAAIAISITLLASCGDKLTNEINKLESKAFSSENAMNQETAEKLVAAYCAFIDANPHSDISPDYLFRAIDVSMNINNPQRTLSLIDRMLKDYPNYHKTQAALFLKGFIFETQYNNLGKAKELYEKYLELYPDGEFATDCKASIENLGVSLEELIRRFEENQ
ncbi:MAG: tol-pal system YbgF family protein [Candidatus Limimorpha sp.]